MHLCQLVNVHFHACRSEGVRSDSPRLGMSHTPNCPSSLSRAVCGRACVATVSADKRRNHLKVKSCELLFGRATSKDGAKRQQRHGQTAPQIGWAAVTRVEPWSLDQNPMVEHLMSKWLILTLRIYHFSITFLGDSLGSQKMTRKCFSTNEGVGI